MNPCELADLPEALCGEPERPGEITELNGWVVGASGNISSSAIDGKNDFESTEIPDASQLQWRFFRATAPAEITPDRLDWRARLSGAAPKI